MGKMVQRRRFGETNWETDREAVYRWIWVEGFRGGGGGGHSTNHYCLPGNQRLGSRTWSRAAGKRTVGKSDEWERWRWTRLVRWRVRTLRQ